MAMHEDSIKALKSTGAKCFWCEREIKLGSPAVRIRFEIPLVLTSATVDREAHVMCADELRRRISAEIEKASRLN